MKSVAGTEIILTVGVLVAVGISIVQLRGVFYSQQLLAQEEVAATFARDLEDVVDKAIGTTGDAAFDYYPPIKKYSVDISNNLVSVFDKVSGKNATFSKSEPGMVDNYFEDCDKIFVVKKGEKIAITCRCHENGEACDDSLICCSGFCNETTKKCEVPPICPQDLRCLGAPLAGGAGDHAWVDINGVTCCPLDNIDDTSGPVCSNKHCCPTHMPKWCDKPTAGDPRCMSEQDYSDPDKCKKNILTLIIIPIRWNDLSNFRQIAEGNADWWISLLPCNINVDKIIVDTRSCQSVSSSGILQCARNWGLIPASDPQGYDWRLVGLSDDWDAEEGLGGFVDCTSQLDDPLCKVSWVTTAWGRMQGGEERTPPFPHELGHTFGLCGEYCGVGDCDGPVYVCGDPNKCPRHCSEINKGSPNPVDPNCVMNNKAASYYHNDNHCKGWLLERALPRPIKYYC